MDYETVCKMITDSASSDFLAVGMQPPIMDTPDIVRRNLHSFFGNLARRVSDIFKNNPTVENTCANNSMLFLYQSMWFARMALHHRSEDAVESSSAFSVEHPMLQTPVRHVSMENVSRMEWQCRSSPSCRRRPG